MPVHQKSALNWGGYFVGVLWLVGGLTLLAIIVNIVTALN